MRKFVKAEPSLVKAGEHRDGGEIRHFAKIRDKNGVSYEYDVTEFYKGGSAPDGPGKVSWSGNFPGRPQLAEEFKRHLEDGAISDHTRTKRIVAARQLFRYLDERGDLPSVSRLSDFTDIHGTQLKRWLRDRGVNSPDIYKNIKQFVFDGRAAINANTLVWPGRDPDPEPNVVEPDYVGLQRLNMALRAEARAVKGMFREGVTLADQGHDPRCGSGRAEAWQIRANQAWLVRHLSTNTIPSKTELLDDHASPLFYASHGVVPGPSYLPPAMSRRGSAGYVGKLRWFFPGLFDTAIYFWLVMIHTGWNASTCFEIDISETSKWREEHPLAPDRVLIHAWKPRAERRQQAICLANAEFHPPTIIEMMIERTAPMRRTLIARLESLRLQQIQNPSPLRAREINKLEDGIKSPWLFVSLEKGGEIGWLSSSAKDNKNLNNFIRAVAVKHGLVDDHPYLETLTTSQARDAWINYAYMSTGELAIAQYAAGHRNSRSIRHYLSRRRSRLYSERKVREFQNYAFSEIREGRLDPTRLRILTETGRFTEQQAVLLGDVRNRTRLNMGCLAPYEPPKSVDPDHPTGELCRVQRCTGCPLGIVFEDSMERLAITLADLHHERSTRSIAAWTGTSLEDEERSLSATLQQFDPDQVRAVYRKRKEALRTGTETVFNAYPLY